jgi:predicted molibdopterin-dependent oxidoreductase YjgC
MTAIGPFRIRSHPILGDVPGAATVHLTVDGRQIQARAGESLAAALLADGVRVFRTMPDSAAPRGYFCGVGRCTDCLVVVDGDLSVRACVTQVRDGMVVTTQQGLGEWEAAGA